MGFQRFHLIEYSGVEHIEPDFSELWKEEPIYNQQFLTLKRLTNLPTEKLLSLTMSEAATFINCIRSKRIHSALNGTYQRANQRRHEAKVRREALSPCNQSFSLSASVTTVVSPDGKVLTQISSLTTKI